MKNIINPIALTIYCQIAVLWIIATYAIASLWVKTIFAVIGMSITRGKTSDRIEVWIKGEQEGMITYMEAKSASFESNLPR